MPPSVPDASDRGACRDARLRRHTLTGALAGWSIGVAVALAACAAIVRHEHALACPAAQVPALAPAADSPPCAAWVGWPRA
ncbi:MAG TPA: hypothetical protein VHL79_02225 [Ramlibacter sp.]|nr:hypothetical protein [Ramlibacter sp.]